MRFQVLGRGLEPPWVSPSAPKAGAYTNSATPASGEWSQVEFCRRRIRSRPRLAAMQLHGNAPPRTKAQKLPSGRFCVLCAPSRIRTCDLLLKREQLYQLSYGRIKLNYHTCAGGGNRTHTNLRSQDFKSCMSTSFITPASLRPRGDSHPRIAVLQTAALLLRHVALPTGRQAMPARIGVYVQ